MANGSSAVVLNVLLQDDSTAALLARLPRLCGFPCQCLSLRSVYLRRMYYSPFCSDPISCCVSQLPLVERKFREAQEFALQFSRFGFRFVRLSSSSTVIPPAYLALPPLLLIDRQAAQSLSKQGSRRGVSKIGNQIAVSHPI